MSRFKDAIERCFTSPAKLPEAARENSVANGRFRRDSAECRATTHSELLTNHSFVSAVIRENRG